MQFARLLSTMLTSLLLLIFSCKSDNTVSVGQDVSISPVIHVLGGVVGSSELSRTEGGFEAKYMASGFTPGDAVTLWWVIYNHPEHCDGVRLIEGGECDPLDFAIPEVGAIAVWADGKVIGDDGEAVFTGTLCSNCDPEAEVASAPTVRRLVNPMGSEVHLGARSHGPASEDANILEAQLNSFFGGCRVELPESEVPDAEGECGLVSFSVHLPDSSLVGTDR